MAKSYPPGWFDNYRRLVPYVIVVPATGGALLHQEGYEIRGLIGKKDRAMDIE